MNVGNEFVGDGGLRHLKTAVGKPVAGEQFFNRTHELADFIEILDEGDNISLIAPRRVGKSSLLREASRRIEDRYLCLHLDVEACRVPADFFAGLARVASEHGAAAGRLRGVFDQFVQGVDALRSEHLGLEIARVFSTGWQERGDRVFQRLSQLERPVVLFLDEVPIFIHRLLTDENRCLQPAGVQRADDFLSWLRAVTLRHSDKLRVVVTGSIGLGPVLQRVGLSATINAFRSMELRPWDEATTCECLRALARNYGLVFESEAEHKIFELLGAGIPHHVQMFFDHVRQHLKRQRVNAVFPGDVETVYEQRMLSSRGHPELSHYEERLKLVLDPQELPMAMDLLTEAALGSLDMATAERLAQEYEQVGDLGNILGILVHDGYLQREGKVYVFESRLVRDWWRHRHEATYKPLPPREAP
jgi:uncharacterized protein